MPTTSIPSWVMAESMLTRQRRRGVRRRTVNNRSCVEKISHCVASRSMPTRLGMRVHVVPLEFQAVMTRIFDSYDYEAAMLGLVSGDADPNPEINVWT